MKFSGACVVGGYFEISVDVPERGRRASVLVSRVGDRSIFWFPHVFAEDGESLGDEAADQGVLDRADQYVRLLSAAVEWSRFCGGVG